MHWMCRLNKSLLTTNGRNHNVDSGHLIFISRFIEYCKLRDNEKNYQAKQKHAR